MMIMRAYYFRVGCVTSTFEISDGDVVFRKRALPTAVTTGLDIGLSNLSLKTITLSFYSECYLQSRSKTNN